MNFFEFSSLSRDLEPSLNQDPRVARNAFVGAFSIKQRRGRALKITLKQQRPHKTLGLPRILKEAVGVNEGGGCQKGRGSTRMSAEEEC